MPKFLPVYAIYHRYIMIPAKDGSASSIAPQFPLETVHVTSNLISTVPE